MSIPPAGRAAGNTAILDHTMATNVPTPVTKLTASVKLPDFRSVIPFLPSTMAEENHFCTAPTVARTFMSPMKFAAMADVPKLPSAMNAAYGAMEWSSKHDGTAV
jgi:hypothetical protein